MVECREYQEHRRPRDKLTSESSSLPDDQNIEPNGQVPSSQHEDRSEDFSRGQTAPDQHRPLPAAPPATNEEWQADSVPPSDSTAAFELNATAAQLRNLDNINPPRTDPTRKSTLEVEPKRSGIDPSTGSKKFVEFESECDVLKARVIELEETLKDAQDFIFSLRPRQQGLTETEAAEFFATLCGSIEEFVDRKLGDALEDKIVIKEGKVALPPSDLLLSLIPKPGKEAFNYPETDGYNITAAILQFLCRTLFDLEFYCPFGDRETQLIASISNSMRTLLPRRDIITYRTWRSETYTAISSLHKFGQLREERARLLTEDLTSILRLFIPRAKSGLTTAVRSSIIEPAFALAHKMHLSVDCFNVTWSSFHDLKVDPRSSFSEDFKDVELVDLVSGRTIKDRTAGTPRYLFDLTPQLVFRKVKGDAYAEPKILKRSKILVSISKDGNDHFRERREEGTPTVLGWLDTKIREHHASHARRGGRR